MFLRRIDESKDGESNPRFTPSVPADHCSGEVAAAGHLAGARLDIFHILLSALR